jgi:GC-rich sequence DNA-binding factor
MSRLSGTLSNLEASHSTHHASLEALNAERGQLDEKEQEMRVMVMVVRAESKRAWFFDMREWMETIATFLDEKVRISSLVLCLLTWFISGHLS